MDIKQLDGYAANLVSARVDLILSIATPSTAAAKKAVEGTDIPVVFVPVTDPVGSAIVNSLKQPGGNITGITFGVQEARRLDWLLKIAPGIRRIYAPYNPADKSPVLALKSIQSVAAANGIEIVTTEIRNAQELDAAVKTIPEGVDAVFFLPDSLLSTRLEDWNRLVAKKGLPTCGANVESVRNRGVLMSFGTDLAPAGKQAARLADQIFQGTSPSALPVETAEMFLAINLKTARRIGLTIPEQILRQADEIIR